MDSTVDATEIDWGPVRAPERRREAYKVMKELRTGLTEAQFHEVCEQAGRADGYTLFGAFRGSRCVAVMGYRILHDFVHGRHLYVDDLVVTESERSGGLGAVLLAEAERIARFEKCAGLRLCTGVENERAKRFYERLGWNPRAVAYKKFPI